MRSYPSVPLWPEEAPERGLPPAALGNLAVLRAEMRHMVHGCIRDLRAPDWHKGNHPRRADAWLLDLLHSHRLAHTALIGISNRDAAKASGKGAP